jgi:hypothetical protein
MAKRERYLLTLQVEVRLPEDAHEMPRYAFQIWRDGIMKSENRLIDLESAASLTKDQAEELGRSLFRIAKEMYEKERS